MMFSKIQQIQTAALLRGKASMFLTFRSPNEVRISLEAQLSQLRQISKTLGQRSQLVIFKMKLLGVNKIHRGGHHMLF